MLNKNLSAQPLDELLQHTVGQWECFVEIRVFSCSGCNEESGLSSTCPIQLKYSHSVTLWFSTGIPVWSKTLVNARALNLERLKHTMEHFEQTNPQIESHRVTQVFVILKWQIKKGLQLQASGWNSKLSSRASLLSVPSPTSRAQTLPWPLQLPLKCSFKTRGCPSAPSSTTWLSALLFMRLLANTKAKPVWIPTHRCPNCTALSHPTLAHFFLQVLSWKFTPAKGLAVLDKRSQCFLWPAGPASLSRNHKTELSPVLAVGGACGQQPCKQMPSDDDHTRVPEAHGGHRSGPYALISRDCYWSRGKTFSDHKYACSCSSP